MPDPRARRMTDAERAQAKATFLEEFRLRGILSHACRAAGVDVSMPYYWQEHDTEFAIEYRAAKQQADDAIRAEIYRRAVEGNTEPLMSNGRVVKNEHGEIQYVQKYSDQLLIFLAKARMAEFREKTAVDVTSNGETVAAPYELIRKALKDEDAANAAIELAERIANHR